MGDHGAQAEASPRWGTVWPNLLQFVGPPPLRDAVKGEAEAAIACFLADRHYTALVHFNAAMAKLEVFPSSEPATPAANGDADDGPAAAAAAAAAAASSASSASSASKTPQSKAQQQNDEQSQQTEAAPVPTEMGHRAALDFIRTSHEYAETSRKTQLADRLLAEAELGNKTWTAVSVDDKTGDGTYYREEAGKDTHSFRVIGNMNCAILELACLLLELDLFSEWFPMCCKSRQVGAITRFERCATFEISCPWPMANREASLWGFAVDDMDKTRRCIIYAENHEREVGGVAPPKKPKGVCRLDVNQCGYVLEATTPTTTKMTFISNIDPKMKLPDWLMNWATGKFCGVLTWQMERSAKKAKKDPKSVYAERKKHPIYEEFAQRIAQIDWSTGAAPAASGAAASGAAAAAAAAAVAHCGDDDDREHPHREHHHGKGHYHAPGPGHANPNQHHAEKHHQSHAPAPSVHQQHNFA